MMQYVQCQREKNKSRGGSGSGSKSAKSSIKDLFVSLPRRDVFLSMPRSRRNRQSPESSTGTANKETVRATNASSALYSQFGTGVTSQNATRYSVNGVIFVSAFPIFRFFCHIGCLTFTKYQDVKNKQSEDFRKNVTSNLRKAHVTRDSSSPATLAISVGLQQ